MPFSIRGDGCSNSWLRYQASYGRHWGRCSCWGRIVGCWKFGNKGGWSGAGGSSLCCLIPGSTLVVSNLSLLAFPSSKGSDRNSWGKLGREVTRLWMTQEIVQLEFSLTIFHRDIQPGLAWTTRPDVDNVSEVAEKEGLFRMTEGSHVHCFHFMKSSAIVEFWKLRFEYLADPGTKCPARVPCAVAATRNTDDWIHFFPFDIDQIGTKRKKKV